MEPLQPQQPPPLGAPDPPPEPPRDPKEVSVWQFFAYYGALYAFAELVILIGYQTGRDVFTPIASLIFPIAGGNSLLKNFIVSTLMYWVMVLAWTLGIQKMKIKW